MPDVTSFARDHQEIVIYLRDIRIAPSVETQTITYDDDVGDLSREAYFQFQRGITATELTYYVLDNMLSDCAQVRFRHALTVLILKL